jgi:hypothetical protein
MSQRTVLDFFKRQKPENQNVSTDNFSKKSRIEEGKFMQIILSCHMLSHIPLPSRINYVSHLLDNPLIRARLRVL